MRMLTAFDQDIEITVRPRRRQIEGRRAHYVQSRGGVTAVDGNKLTIKFDKAGEKRVVDSFVERV